MEDRPATLTIPAAGQREPARPRIPAPLLAMGLVLVALLFLHLLQNGYRCFRSDHLTHLPLLYKMNDPSLFPRDWFMIENAPIDLRRLHLLLLEYGAIPFGMPVGILVSFCVTILGTFAAWVAISRRLFATAAPGLAVIAMAIMVHGMEIGSNQLIEHILIPRTEACLFAWWGFYFLLGSSRRDWLGGLASGLLLSVAGYFQPAIGAQFGLALLIWLIVDPARRDWARTATFTAALLAPQLGKFLTAAGSVLKEASRLTDAEQIQLAAYIRHPHHMIPHLWPGKFAVFAGLLLVFIVIWNMRRRDCPVTRSLGRLVFIILSILAISTVFIEIVPVKAVILFQPFRLSILLYPVMFLIMAPHVVELFASGRFSSRVRAVLLIASLQSWELMIPAAAFEVFAIRRDKQARPLDPKQILGMAAAVILIGSLINHDFFWLFVWIPLVPGLAMLAEKKGWLERPAIVYGALGTIAVAGVLAVSAFFWLPFDRWVDDDASPYRHRAARLAYRYQFNPIPLMSIERLAVWAGKNTEPNALFIVPPEREPAGFRIWSRRSVWFNIKFFPYRAATLEEWRSRYLAVCGIPDINDPARAADVQRALNDISGDSIQDDYELLTVDYIKALGRRIVSSKLEGPGPLYIITPTAYNDPALELLHQDADRQHVPLTRNLNYLYRIHLN